MEKKFFEIYSKEIYERLDSIIKNNIPDAVLLSGGIDSSVIAYLSKKYNPNVVGITVVTEGEKSPDKLYAKQVADMLGIDLKIAVLKNEEIDNMIKEIVLSLENFNIFRVSASLVLYKGLDYGKSLGYKKIATGEGADDLFGSFPVMLNWQKTESELNDFINNRLLDIDLMTFKVSKNKDIEIILPYHDNNIKDYIMNIPLNDRMVKDNLGKPITKYLLRESFKQYLPEQVVYRPQTMAFTGASIFDLLLSKYEKNDIPLKSEKYGLIFDTKFQSYLFNILDGGGKYTPVSSGNKCIYCRSKLRSKNSVHCTTCATLQYKGKKLAF